MSKKQRAGIVFFLMGLALMICYAITPALFNWFLYVMTAACLVFGSLTFIGN
jgi:hypothetical protein